MTKKDKSSKYFYEGKYFLYQHTYQYDTRLNNAGSTTLFSSKDVFPSLSLSTKKLFYE